MLNEIVQPLISWYRQNKRILPWRDQKNAYYTWVSEIMLQQTRVEAVKPYFLRFIGELPDVKALAECPEEKLMKLWEGLGYYNRVRNMQTAAQTVVSEYSGILPASYEVSEVTQQARSRQSLMIFLFRQLTVMSFVFFPGSPRIVRIS